MKTPFRIDHGPVALCTPYAKIQRLLSSCNVQKKTFYNRANYDRRKLASEWPGNGCAKHAMVISCGTNLSLLSLLASSFRHGRRIFTSPRGLLFRKRPEYESPLDPGRLEFNHFQGLSRLCPVRGTPAWNRAPSPRGPAQKSELKMTSRLVWLVQFFGARGPGSKFVRDTANLLKVL